jgi:hypothetical protein
MRRSSGDRKGAGPRAQPSDSRRKLIEFDAGTWHALHQLAKDSVKSLQELADEAFADLLRKHGRPTDLKQALKESARRLPANDARPRGRKRSS